MTQEEIAALHHIVATATNPEKEIPELLERLAAVEKPSERGDREP